MLQAVASAAQAARARANARLLMVFMADPGVEMRAIMPKVRRRRDGRATMDPGLMAGGAMSDLKAQFEQAQKDVKTLTKRPDNNDMLLLYAHYKQASEGDVKGSR